MKGRYYLFPFLDGVDHSLAHKSTTLIDVRLAPTSGATADIS
jgi:hypothetical protein